MTTFQAALKADWAPAIESTARFVGVAIACVIVAADWLGFTWQHPWAGLRALEFPGAAISSPNLASSSPRSAASSPRSAPSSPRSAASSPRSECVAPLLLLPAPLPIPDCEECEGYGEVTDFSGTGVEVVWQCPECDGTGKQESPALEPIAPAPAPRKRGRRATRQPKAA
jgi:hypothetical protein